MLKQVKANKAKTWCRTFGKPKSTWYVGDVTLEIKMSSGWVPIERITQGFRGVCD